MMFFIFTSFLDRGNSPFIEYNADEGRFDERGGEKD
jgi:hypothetical protein